MMPAIKKKKEILIPIENFIYHFHNKYKEINSLHNNILYL